MEEQKKRKHPGRLFGLWTITMLVLTVISTVLSGIGASGGEQRPFRTFVFMLLLTASGAAIISASIPFMYRQWFRENLLAGILLIVLTVIPVLGFIWVANFETSYYSVESTRYVGGDTIEIKKEFYDDEERRLRSISYWINGQKDSIWTTYDREGKIIKQKVY